MGFRAYFINLCSHRKEHYLDFVGSHSSAFCKKPGIEQSVQACEASEFNSTANARQKILSCFRIVKDCQKVVHTKKKEIKLLPNSVE
jgi:hypothetical protein